MDFPVAAFSWIATTAFVRGTERPAWAVVFGVWMGCALNPKINAAFTPSEEEIAEAQEIVDIFAANPGVGAIGYKGGMLDRPYLSRAQQLLRQVGRQ